MYEIAVKQFASVGKRQRSVVDFLFSISSHHLSFLSLFFFSVMILVSLAAVSSVRNRTPESIKGKS